MLSSCVFSRFWNWELEVQILIRNLMIIQNHSWFSEQTKSVDLLDDCFFTSQQLDPPNRPRWKCRDNLHAKCSQGLGLSMARYGSVDHKITNLVEICLEKQKYKNDFRHSLIFRLCWGQRAGLAVPLCIWEKWGVGRGLLSFLPWFGRTPQIPTLWHFLAHFVQRQEVKQSKCTKREIFVKRGSEKKIHKKAGCGVERCRRIEGSKEIRLAENAERTWIAWHSLAEGQVPRAAVFLHLCSFWLEHFLGNVPCTP